MNKRSILGMIVAAAIVVSVIIISYANMSSTKSDNVIIINPPSNSTNQVKSTTGKSYTLNLTESIAVKNP
jgi:hypothetical protein